jgi:hypothetical protein
MNWGFVIVVGVAVTAAFTVGFGLAAVMMFAGGKDEDVVRVWLEADGPVVWVADRLSDEHRRRVALAILGPTERSNR